jgi:hypothetical protein
MNYDPNRVKIFVYEDLLSELSRLKPEDQNLTQFINHIMRTHLTEEATK